MGYVLVRSGVMAATAVCGGIRDRKGHPLAMSKAELYKEKREVEERICRHLGLPPERVTRIVLTLDAADMPSFQVTVVLADGTLRALADVILDYEFSRKEP